MSRHTTTDWAAVRADLTATVQGFDSTRTNPGGDLHDAYLSLAMQHTLDNCLLILAQARPGQPITGACDVDFHDKWWARGRTVNHGEHSYIKVLTACPDVTKAHVADEERLESPDGSVVIRRTGWRIGSLFHTAQTHETTDAERADAARRRQARQLR